MQNPFLRILIVSYLCLWSCFAFASQPREQIHTEISAREFKQIHKQFESNLNLFNEERIKFRKTFIDTLMLAQKWSKKNGNAKQQLIGDFQVLFAYDQLIKNDSIIKLGNELLAQKDFLEMKEAALTANILLNAYDRKGFYSKKLQLFPLFKELNTKHKVFDEINSYHLEVAMILYKIGFYDKAREEFKEQFKIYLNNGNLFMAASMMNNIGLTYQLREEFDSAISAFNESLALLEKDKEVNPKEYDLRKEHFSNVVNSNLATINFNLLNLDNVEVAFMRELESSKRFSEPRTTIQAYQNLAKYYLLTKDFNLANKYIDSSYLLLRTYESPAFLARAHTIKAQYYLTQRNTKIAKLLNNKSKHIRDSIENVQEKKMIEEATLKFNLDEMEDELSSSKELLESNEAKSFYQLIALVTSVLAFFILFLFYDKVKQKKQELEDSRVELAKALRINQTMLQEIKHRIKNNLQLISSILFLQTSKLEDKKSIEIINEAQKYIQSMAFIHEHLYEKGDTKIIHMCDFINSLVDALILNFTAIEINTEVNCSDIQLETNKATPLGFIICELITNSAKHAFDKKGTITIDFVSYADGYLFKYKDSGKGFDTTEQFEKKHIGLNLIDILVKEIKGNSKKYIDGGFVMEIYFNN